MGPATRIAKRQSDSISIRPACNRFLILLYTIYTNFHRHNASGNQVNSQGT